MFASTVKKPNVTIRKKCVHMPEIFVGESILCSDGGVPVFKIKMLYCRLALT